jgi:putative effector of murein hydrolase LrgA (UPF0299 family)
LGLGAAILTSLVILAFWYWVEFAQAVFLLTFPMTLVGLMSLNSARLIHDRQLAGEALRKRLLRHRIQTQVVGMISIFVTSLFGMFQNMMAGPLGAI